MEKARCNTELYSNLREPLNNVKPSNFWGSHQNFGRLLRGALWDSSPRLSDFVDNEPWVLIPRDKKRAIPFDIALSGCPMGFEPMTFRTTI